MIEEICEKLRDEVYCRGIQKDGDGNEHGYIFIDKQTGSSFLIEKSATDIEQAILTRLKKIRRSFEN